MAWAQQAEMGGKRGRWRGHSRPRWRGARLWPWISHGPRRRVAPHEYAQRQHRREYWDSHLWYREHRAHPKTRNARGRKTGHWLVKMALIRKPILSVMKRRWLSVTGRRTTTTFKTPPTASNTARGMLTCGACGTSLEARSRSHGRRSRHVLRQILRKLVDERLPMTQLENGAGYCFTGRDLFVKLLGTLVPQKGTSPRGIDTGGNSFQYGTRMESATSAARPRVSQRGNGSDATISARALPLRVLSAERLRTPFTCRPHQAQGKSD